MKSRFNGLLEEAKDRGQGAGHADNPPGGDPLPSANPPPALPAAGPQPRGPGRPKGKRSDPAFKQVTAYIPEELQHKVKLALIRERQGREFSELVADLLADWLERRPRDRSAR